MARTIGVYSLPAVFIAVAWMRLEEVKPEGLDAVWAVALALVPALAPTLLLRLALVVPAALAAVWLAFDRPFPGGRPGFFGPVLDRFGDGFLDYYDVTLPFSALEHPRMHGVIVIAIFGFCVVLGQAVAARRPLPAVLALIAGAGWPVTLYPTQSIGYGAFILAAALFVLAGVRATRAAPALAGGAAIVLAAAAASTSAAIAKEGVLAWEQWEPSSSRAPVSVAYVWDANYDGIEFPAKRRTVLRIEGTQRGLYWRATTLDQFDDDRWLESLTPISTGLARGPLPNDPLLPARAANPRTWVRQDVEVVALRDPHIVAAAQPVALDAPALGGVFRLSGGVVTVAGGVAQGTRYTVRSYAPRPQPADLARIEAAYPPALDRFLDIGRTRVEPFGAAGRDDRVDALFADDRYAALWPYEQLWEQARRLRAGARTPYGAVVAIETWLRSTGGFRYDESPPRPAGLPALAHFVAEGKAGYCQHFAGAMALMLRFLGIPARVAAGFTSGKFEDGGWTVTDHNAHTWVEVWFDGYGWLPFDPTPGRGSLAAAYSASSATFNAGDAAEAFGPSSVSPDGGGAGELGRLALLKEQLAERAQTGDSRDGGRDLGTLWLVLLLVGVLAALVTAAKSVRRRLRYATRDPRRLAAAARAELADFLVDQGVEVPASATPEELHDLVRAEFGADGRRFADALAQARFGPGGEAAQAARRARRELRALLRVLRRRLGLTARLRGLVALRSLRA
ncbi:MAG TPA: transglutaminaseTgpA domain-containing protein [Gaiellaceae bacterium]